MDYFSVYPDTPPRRKKGDYRCSVHYGNSYRLECAKKQLKCSPVPVETIVEYTTEFLKSIGIQTSKAPKMKPTEIDYGRIKKENGLKDKRDIVWMKFTTDGYLGVVASSNDINFDIPTSEKDYDQKRYKTRWMHTSSGILVHQLQKEWDTSFVLVFPLRGIPDLYKRGDIERAVGNYLIDQKVPIIDFYSHNY